MDETSATFSGLEATSFAQAIELVLSNPEEAVRKSEQAYLRVKDFSVEQMVQDYVKVYREVLEGQNK